MAARRIPERTEFVYRVRVVSIWADAGAEDVFLGPYIFQSAAQRVAIDEASKPGVERAVIETARLQPWTHATTVERT